MTLLMQPIAPLGNSVRPCSGTGLDRVVSRSETTSRRLDGSPSLCPYLTGDIEHSIGAALPCSRAATGETLPGGVVWSGLTGLGGWRG